MVIAPSRPDGGVDVAGIALGDPEGRLEYAPDHPLADEDGYVRAPDMDMASQMTQLVMAQRGFQASVQRHQERPGHLQQRPADRTCLDERLRDRGASAASPPFVAPYRHRARPRRPPGTQGAGERSPRSASLVARRHRAARGGARTSADRLAVQAATGDLGDIHDYTIAATETGVDHPAHRRRPQQGRRGVHRDHADAGRDEGQHHAGALAASRPPSRRSRPARRSSRSSAPSRCCSPASWCSGGPPPELRPALQQPRLGRTPRRSSSSSTPRASPTSSPTAAARSWCRATRSTRPGSR